MARRRPPLVYYGLVFYLRHLAAIALRSNRLPDLYRAAHLEKRPLGGGLTMPRPLNTLEDWKEKIGEYNLESLAEAGWAIETLLDELIYLRQKVNQLQSLIDEPKS